MNDTTLFQQNTPAWLFFAKASFALSVFATGIGIFFLPAAVWVKGYLAMGLLYVMGSSFILSKTLRDDFEAQKLVNRLSEAQTEKLLKEYDGEPAMS